MESLFKYNALVILVLYIAFRYAFEEMIIGLGVPRTVIDETVTLMIMFYLLYQVVTLTEKNEKLEKELNKRKK